MALAVISLTAGAPASAQGGPLERAINTGFHRCMWSAAPLFSPDGKIRDREPSIPALEALRDRANPNPSDLALIQYDLVIAHNIIAGAHVWAREDAAACARYERAWTEAVRLDPLADHRDAQLMRDVRAKAAENARKCRETHPAPDGAPLPG